MAGKDELLDSVPTMKRRSAATVPPQGNPTSSANEKVNSPGPTDEDVIDKIRPRKAGTVANVKKGSLFDLKAAERPNSKGAVNLLLAPELKARLDAANYASKVPRVQIVIAALDEYLEKNGF